MAERPRYFPFMDLSESNQIDWGSSPLRLTGFAPGQVVPSAEHNTLWFLGSLWTTYLDYNTLRTNEIIEGTRSRWSATRLEYPIGDSTNIGGAVPTTLATYWFNGYRIQIDEQMLAPAGAYPLLQPLATAPGRLWIYIKVDINDPTDPVASARVESVAPATAASPVANEFAAVGVDIDAAGAITGNVYPGSEPAYELRFAGPSYRYTTVVNFDADVQVIGPAIFTADLGVIGELEVGPAGAGSRCLTVNPSVVGDESARITGNGTDAALLIAASGSIGIDVDTTSNTNATIRVRQAGQAPAIAASITGAQGTAVTATGAGTGAGLSATGGASGNGVTATSGATAGDGVAGTSGNITGHGVRGTGANAATSFGVLGVATHVDGYGVEGLAAGGASASGAGITGLGQGDASGVRAVATNGYAVVAVSDTTAPTRAPIRMAPQNDDPTTAAQGDLTFNSSRTSLGKLRVFDVAQWTSVHSTPLGYVFAVGLAASNAVPFAGGSGNLSLAQITPEEVGIVCVTGTVSITYTGDTGQVSLQIWDITAGTLLAASVERGPDIDLAGNPSKSAIVRASYTLPDTATRTFAVVLDVTASTAAYSNAITTVQGVV